MLWCFLADPSPPPPSFLLLLLLWCCCLCNADASISPDGVMAAADTWCLTDPAAEAAAAAAADEQLTEKLLPLAVGLYRSEALSPTLQQYKSNAGEEVKDGVREVVQQVLPVLLAACGDSLPPQQGYGAGGGEAWDQLQVSSKGRQGWGLGVWAGLGVRGVQVAERGQVSKQMLLQQGEG
jgi:hypothetical protein